MSARLTALLAVVALGLGACSADAGSSVEKVIVGDGLDEPSALASRPGRDELWVINRGNDSITIVSDPGGKARAVTRRDAFAEHFVALPSGISFDASGGSFAVANDSNNEVRDLVFIKNPERNRYFKNNNFMGPALFNSATYGLAGQSKRYLEDWPQPGYGHDPPDDTPRDDCPDEYWSEEVSECQWPREGSHLDMLHGSPLSAGILNDDRNVYFVLDGCGSRTAANKCRGDGHVVLVDFNRDHQEGNGFHGDGVIRRYIDAPFERVDGVASGIVRHGDSIYYADTGPGVVRRLRPGAGRRQVLVGPWHEGPASHRRSGPGITDWSHVEDGPGDGDDPAVIDRWIADAGNRREIAAARGGWIKPMETLGEYSYVRGARGEAVVGPPTIEQPSGLAASEESLFVADRATGRVHEISWNGLRPKRVIETGKKGLSGLAHRDGSLYVTDVASDGVYRLPLR
jgi:hypothetical protein